MFTIPPRKIATLVTRIEYIFCNNIHIPIFIVKVKYKSLKITRLVEISIVRRVIRSECTLRKRATVFVVELHRKLSIFIVGVILLTIKVIKTIVAYQTCTVDINYYHREFPPLTIPQLSAIMFFRFFSNPPSSKSPTA